MKNDIHPEFRNVVFLDMSCNKKFIIGASVKTSETIKMEDGNTYPLVRVEISSASHPFYTGEKGKVTKLGNIEKFNKRYNIK